MKALLFVPIFLPIIAGTLIFLKGRGIYALITSLITLIASAIILSLPEASVSVPWFGDGKFELRSSFFPSLMLLFSSLFSFLIILYSLKFIKDERKAMEYYPYTLITLGAANGVFLSDNFIPFFVFWGMTTIMLFTLTTLGRAEPWRAALKAFMMVGACDLSLLLGIILLRKTAGTLTISEAKAGGSLALLSFVFITIGALGKAGSMPFHSWIPRMAQSAPTPVLALLPASLYKLMGIYLLTISAINIFELTRAFSLFLMSIGSATVIFAVLMALVQRDVRKLLSFHAVSEVGYMVIGIGTGVPLGVVGGVFHMLNSAIYKTCLFLGGGSVEHRAGRTELEKLGGLSRLMPVSFWTFLISSLAISGIPPLNGFVSKWMIYQGVIDFGGKASWIFLLAAMFGSALTLASFVKLVYSIFLGERPRYVEVRESEGSILFPLIVLASLCVIFGILAHFPLLLISSSLGFETPRLLYPLAFLGLWNPTLATLLILIAIFMGFGIYVAGRLGGAKTAAPFIGGERMDPAPLRVPGVYFYDTIRYMGFFTWAYEIGEAGLLDIYNILRLSGKGLAFIIFRFERLIDKIITLPSRIPLGEGLRKLHTGYLPLYVIWCLVGLSILILILR